MLSVRKTYPDCLPFSFIPLIFPLPNFRLHLSSLKAAASKFRSKRLKLFLLFPPQAAEQRATDDDSRLLSQL